MSKKSTLGGVTNCIRSRERDPPTTLRPGRKEPDLFTTGIRAASGSLRQGGAMSTTVDTTTEIPPFRIEIPDEQIDNLRQRVAATRWPTKELVPDRSQGVQLATLQELARYWTSEYVWRKCEARLNGLRRGRDPLHPRQVAA
jgi:hypothetical protein